MNAPITKEGENSESQQHDEVHGNPLSSIEDVRDCSLQRDKGIEADRKSKLIQMAKRGGKRVGAGRKSNAQKLVEAGFVANWFTAEFQEIKWRRLLESADERVVERTMEYLSDRIYGKSTQAIELTAELSLAERISEARKRNEC
jgi:hypothetical protein